MKSILMSKNSVCVTIASVCLLVALLSLVISNSAVAAGVSLSSTRVIYPREAKQATINVTNRDQHDSFLVQSWVSDVQGTKVTDFTVTPPLFVIKPGKSNILRIIYSGSALPADRESVFYLNNKAIPSLSNNMPQGNSLQIATQAVIKLFVRPANLTMKPSDAAATLRCQATGGEITVSNPSPYFVTLVNFTVAGKKQPNTMVPPKGRQIIRATGAVSYQTLNDYGAVTAALNCKA